MDILRLLDLTEQILILRGGPTSGNWGHSGRKGKRGGSGRGGGFGKIKVKPGTSRKKVQQAARKISGKGEPPKTTRKPSSKKQGKPQEKPKAKLPAGGTSLVSTGSKRLDDIFSKAPKGTEKNFTNHLVNKVANGEITFGEAKALKERYNSDADKPKSKQPAKPDVSPQKPKPVSSIKATDVTDAEMKKAYTGWYNKLSNDERDGIILYQGSDYMYINSNLRKGKSSVVSDETRVLDKAISKASTPKDMTVYRGTSLDTYTAQLGSDPSKWIGKTFEDKGYMSTTLDKEIAFSGVQAKINVPKGTKAAYLEYVADRDSGYGEEEMLLGRGTKMRITGVNVGADGAVKSIETEVIK